MWKRLDLTEEEWLECQRSAAEMSIASGTRVSPRQVAVEFALARAFEDPTVRMERAPLREEWPSVRPLRH